MMFCSFQALCLSEERSGSMVEMLLDDGETDKICNEFLNEFSPTNRLVKGKSMPSLRCGSFS